MTVQRRVRQKHEVDRRRTPLLTSVPVTSAPGFNYRRRQLCCEQVPLKKVAAAVSTPCYVYSRAAILANFRQFNEAFASAEALICYAVKANSNLSILRLLSEHGSGFDVVSGGELRRLSRVGADMRKVLFSGVGKTPSELRLALENDLLAVNVESLEELRTLARIAAEQGSAARVSLRLNPDIEVHTHPHISTGMRQHKFGIDPDRIGELTSIIRSADGRLELLALGCHIGSQILDLQPFYQAFAKIKALAEEFRSRGLPVKMLDLGGGIGIPHRGEAPAPLTEYGRFLAQQRDGYELVLEPGRYIVGNAGALLTQALYRKSNRDRRFLIVDGAMNDFMRPALYQAYHEVLPVRQGQSAGTADVVGPVCESGDFFAKERPLPDIQQGELLAVMNAGAYGFALASNYNSRPRAAEVMVDGEEFQVIRRRESFEDLVRLEE